MIVYHRRKIEADIMETDELNVRETQAAIICVNQSASCAGLYRTRTLPSAIFRKKWRSDE